MQTIHGAFGASTKIWDIVLKLSVVAPKMRLSGKDCKSVYPPSSSSIHFGFFEVPE